MNLWSESLRPLLFNLIRLLLFNAVFHSTCETIQHSPLPYSHTVEWGAHRNTYRLQFGMWPKIKQVLCHDYSTVTTEKPSVILQEYFSCHVTLMCAKEHLIILLKIQKKNNYCQLSVLFPAQYKTFWLRRTPHRSSQFLIFQVHSPPKVAYGLDIPHLCKGLKKQNINRSSSKHTHCETHTFQQRAKYSRKSKFGKHSKFTEIGLNSV